MQTAGEKSMDIGRGEESGADRGEESIAGIQTGERRAGISAMES